MTRTFLFVTLRVTLFIAFCANSFVSTAQELSNKRSDIPAVLSAISYDSSGVLTYTRNGKEYKDQQFEDLYVLPQMYGKPRGTAKGIAMDFGAPELDGYIVYGPVAENTNKYPTVLWGNGIGPISGGKAEMDILDNTRPNKDFLHISESGHGVMAYRVLNSQGTIIYEGRVAFSGKGPFTVLPTIVEGPFVNELSPNGCVISFETGVPVQASIEVAGKSFKDEIADTHHEIALTGLTAATDYTYTVNYGDKADRHSFKTAPNAGSRKSFTFAFASATRSISANGARPALNPMSHMMGGNERHMWGVNAQALRSIMAVAGQADAVFFQASGDFTSGNTSSVEGHLLDYANWKRAVEPWWHSIPVYTTTGNHEGNYRYFLDPAADKYYRIDNFPYETVSGETAFAKAFANPQNGPDSEDGSVYDPDQNQIDFPTYKENVYYYTYDNVAMIVLNSDYWLGPDTESSSNRDGYIMDNQLEWLTRTVGKFENDGLIDHIFVSVHSSLFPNGDHMVDAFWHNGNNEVRAKVAGESVAQGILERRDQILDLLVNNSSKFVAVLTGDEHIFALTEVTADMPMYPENYNLPKLKLSRPFYQILNGAGGSAVYAVGGDLGRPIWVDNVKTVSAPPVVCLITVDGKQVSAKAVNAETLETVCAPVSLR